MKATPTVGLSSTKIDLIRWLTLLGKTSLGQNSRSQKERTRKQHIRWVNENFFCNSDAKHVTLIGTTATPPPWRGSRWGLCRRTAALPCRPWARAPRRTGRAASWRRGRPRCRRSSGWPRTWSAWMRRRSSSNRSHLVAPESIKSIKSIKVLVSLNTNSYH